MGKFWQSLKTTAEMQMLFLDTVFDHHFAPQRASDDDSPPAWPELLEELGNDRRRTMHADDASGPQGA